MASSTSSKRRHLCEGWAEGDVDTATGLLLTEGKHDAAHQGEVCPIEFGYIVQGDKAVVLLGESSQRADSLRGLQVVESLDALDDLVEYERADGSRLRVPRDGRFIVEGPSQRADVKNANQRIYPRKLWEKLIADPNSSVQTLIREGGMFGHLEHPKDGRSDLDKAAILTISSELREDGTVWNKFQLLSTPGGLLLQALTRDGVRWGVSSRGTGSIAENGIVNESDFSLKTWDAVAAPSTPGAFVKERTITRSRVTSESRNESQNTDNVSSLSESTLQVVGTLSELAETDIGGLDQAERLSLRFQLLRTLNATLGSDQVSRVMVDEASAATVHSSFTLLRQLLEEDSVDFERAIDEALADGGEESDDSRWTEVVEALEERVTLHVQEQRTLQERVEAAEADAESWRSRHDAALEQLSEVRVELARKSAECELANELLSEAVLEAKATSDRVSQEVVEGLLAEDERLEQFRPLIERELTESAARTTARGLLDLLGARSEASRHVPAQAQRSTLPVGAVSSVDYVTESEGSPSPSKGAQLASQALRPAKN